MSERFNELVRNLPVAEFYYSSGNHPRPVHRRVLVTTSDRKHITGYEVKEGNTRRSVENAPVKTYLKCRIATRGQCRSDSTIRKVQQNRLSETTLIRLSLATSGVM
jgi:hypothetical protein